MVRDIRSGLSGAWEAIANCAATCMTILSVRDIDKDTITPRKAPYDEGNDSQSQEVFLVRVVLG